MNIPPDNEFSIFQLGERRSAVIEAEDRFRNLANSAPIMIWMSDHSGRCTFLNQKWLDFTGRTLDQELKDGWLEGVYSEDQQACLETYGKALRAQEPFKMEYRLQRVNGDFRWILNTGSPRLKLDGTFLGFINSAVDISEYKEIEEALREEKDFTSHIVNAAPTLIGAIDVDGRTLFANQSVTKVTGYSSDELLGQNWWEVFYPGDEYQQVETLFKDFQQKGQIVNYEMGLITKEGKKRFISWNSVNKLDPDGKILNIIGIGIDVTERKDAENKLKEAHQDLEAKVNERTIELSKANASLKEEVFNRKRAENVMQLIFEGTTSMVGQDFFQCLVKQLALALQANYAFVSEFDSKYSMVRTLAFWTPTGFLQNFEYQVTNTPCEKVMNGEIFHFPEGVQTQFPLDQQLIKLCVEGYLAIPLTDPSGKVLGHLAVLNNTRMSVEPYTLPVLKTYAARATAELQRKAAEEALQEGKDQYSSILASAMDAIITINEDQKVTVFNDAAEKMFNCPRGETLGQPLDRFIPERFRHVHKEHVEHFGQSNMPSRPMTSLRTVYGMRKQGEEFPIEASISQVTVGGKKLFTVILRDITERNRAEAEINKLQHTATYLLEEIKEQYNFENMIGISPSLNNVFHLVKKVAPTNTIVLITGETGTGKELIARAIHNLSQRKNKVLLKVNCAAIPAGLMESEFFGHEKGAFTGALARKIGRFELADCGTIFLDEIGELPLDLQPKLLRVLEQGEFERVGGSRTIKVDVRVIAATNRSLKQSVQEGLFRSDLYYRLNHITLSLPPLRERKEDILLLAKYFTQKYNAQLGKSVKRFSVKAEAALTHYHWPGNVRELEHVIERAVLLSEGSVLEVVDTISGSEKPDIPFSFSTLEEAERAHITKVLEATQWRVSGEKGAAKLLGLKRTTLESKMHKLGIRKDS